MRASKIGEKVSEDSSESSFDIEITTGTDYEGASGKITFLENGDIVGSGYDICTFGDFQNAVQTCNAVWKGEVVP